MMLFAVMHRRGMLAAALLALGAGAASAWPPRPWGRWTVETPGAGLVEVFRHVRVDREARLVEFDARVAVNAHAPDGSVVFLEVIACRPDTKEHESLVVTEAEASHVHAALLLLGLEPGKPGGWRWEGTTLLAVPPEGPGLEVWVSWAGTDGVTVECPATDLIVNRHDGMVFTEFLRLEREARREGSDTPDQPDGGEDGDGEPRAFHVFAGSRFVVHDGREVYDAEGTGLVVGLHTFGSEVVALTKVMSHEASVLEPEWIARRDLLPERGTEVVVRVIATQ